MGWENIPMLKKVFFANYSEQREQRTVLAPDWPGQDAPEIFLVKVMHDNCCRIFFLQFGSELASLERLFPQKTVKNVVYRLTCGFKGRLKILRMESF